MQTIYPPMLYVKWMQGTDNPDDGFWFTCDFPMNGAVIYRKENEMKEYPWTQADQTPEIDHEANEAGAQMEELAALESANKEFVNFAREALMNCSIDNHAGADDFECKFCNKARAIRTKYQLVQS